MAKRWPKVLTISTTAVGNVANGSILMRNLFEDWPRERLISLYSDSRYPPEAARVASSFKMEGGNDGRLANILTRIPQRFRGDIESVDGFIDFNCSRRLRAWLRTEKPDIIYSHLGSISMTRASLACRNELDIPLVNHIMDDYISVWPSRGRISQFKLLHSYLNNINQKYFRAALDTASVNLTISPAMSMAYQDRYNLNFDVISNGVYVPDMAVVERVRDGDNAAFKFLYMGSIASNINRHSIAAVASTVNSLDDSSITLDILSGGLDVADDYAGRNVTVLPRIAHDQVKELMQTYDGLLLPYNFDDESLQFIRLSLPTRLAEYFSSGVPVFCVGSKNTQFISDIVDFGAVYHVDTTDKVRLAVELKKFTRHFEMRHSIVEKALKYTADILNISTIKTKFQSILIQAAMQK